MPRTNLAALSRPLDPGPGSGSEGSGVEQNTLGKQVTLPFLRNPQRPWIHLSGRLGRMAKSRFVDVHIEGAEKTATFRIPLNRNGSINEVLPVTADATAVCIEFSTEDSSVIFQETRVAEISELERTLRLLDRVWRFDSQSLLEIPLLERLSELDRLYTRVRARRLDRLRWKPYDLFINKVEAPQIAKDQQRAASEAFSRKNARLITFEVYVSEATPEARRRTLESLHAQTYPHWRLAATDAPEPARAVWLVPVQAGDILRPDALQQILWAWDSAAEALLIYSDHDFIGQEGERHTPAFKPDWNPDLFYTHNYLADLCAFRAEICRLHKVEGGALLEEAVRYGLILQVADSCPRGVHHISQVLCHRSAVADGSPTLGFGAQSDILQRHLGPSGAVVEAGFLAGTSRVRWPLPEALPLVSLIIATRDQSKVLEACIGSIQSKTQYPRWEIVLLDNQSSEPATHSYFERLRSDPRIRVVPYPKAFNYSALQNFGVRHSRGEVLVFLNNDVEVLSPTWLEDMVRHAGRPDVGAVGARLLYSDGSIQHAGVALGIGGVAGHVHRFFSGESPGYCGRIQLTQELSAVTAACLAVRKSAFEAVGGFDEKHLKVALNDVDLCLKLTAHGLRNIYEPAVLLYHHESLSRGPDDTPRKRRIFSRERRKMLSRWKARLKRDPHYNENLTLHSEDYGLRVEGV